MKRGSLGHPREIKETYRSGRTASDKALRLKVLRRGDKLETKVAFVVSKKHGSAVRRNRIKRLLREAWRKSGLCPGGYNLIVEARTGLEPSLESYQQSLKKLLAQEMTLEN